MAPALDSRPIQPNEPTVIATEAAPQWSRVRVLDFDIDRVKLEDLLNWAISSKRSKWVITLNLNYMTIARRDPAFAGTVPAADVNVADAMPLVWVANALGQPVPERITGHDLVRQAAALSAERGYGMFLLGGAPGVAAGAAGVLQQRHPGLRVFGTDGGNFSDSGEAEEPERLRDQIREFSPHFLFVALGVPKQDFWIHANLEQIDVPLISGIGCVFDVLTGRINRAPAWMQQISAEWVFQLYQEPGRLWRRFILGNIPTALRIGADVLKQRL